ncbi:membrane-bound PQQ-dependent dehydrogenase, glucose/quinate/shikimate family, partial [Thioclava sp. BHET1]
MTENLKTVSRAARGVLVVLGILFALVGIYLIIGGGMLIARGGSWYYILMGLAVLAAGIQIARARSNGVLIYGAAVIVTVLWALWESGLDFWALEARILTFTMAAMVLALFVPLLRRAEGKASCTRAAAAAFVVLLLVNIGWGWGMFVPHGIHNSEADLAANATAPATPKENWETYGGNGKGQRFAGLTQITPANVKNLKVAWTFHTGDVPISPGGGGSEDQQTPLQVGNTLFL